MFIETRQCCSGWKEKVEEEELQDDKVWYEPSHYHQTGKLVDTHSKKNKY